MSRHHRRKERRRHITVLAGFLTVCGAGLMVASIWMSGNDWERVFSWPQIRIGNLAALDLSGLAPSHDSSGKSESTSQDSEVSVSSDSASGTNFSSVPAAPAAPDAPASPDAPAAPSAPAVSSPGSSSALKSTTETPMTPMPDQSQSSESASSFQELDSEADVSSKARSTGQLPSSKSDRKQSEAQTDTDSK